MVAAAKSTASIDSKSFFDESNSRIMVEARLRGVHTCRDSAKAQAYDVFPTGVKKR
jgi:hypothetical protein